MNVKTHFTILLVCLVLFSCGKEADPPRKPNILFAISDDASFPHKGAYGTDWVHTPNFDRVAKEGLLFMKAFTPNAKCAPSRSIILTGRNSWQLEEAANHVPFFPEKFKSFMEVLAAEGYHAGFTGKGWAPGNPGEINGKRRELTGKRYSNKTLSPPTSKINKNDYSSNFIDFLEDREGEQPFFFWYGCTEPHRAYEFQSGVNMGGKSLDDIDRVPAFWPDVDSVRHDMLDYAYEIEHFDHHLGNMIATLEERGELENTIIVITSDNGMPFPKAKGNAYLYSHHLPLAIMWPAGIKNPGRVIEDYISFIDFAPTFLELAEIDPEEAEMPEIEGKSFTDIFYTAEEGRINTDRNAVIIGQERHDVGRPNDVGYPIRGIITDEYIYLHNFENERWPAGNPQTGYLNTDGSPTKTVVLNSRREEGMRHFWVGSFGKRPQEELYLVPEDRECIQNLALHAEHQERKDNLKRLLFEELRRQKDPRMFGQGHVFDEYPYAQSDMRNFFERYMQGEKLEPGWVNPTDFEPDFR